MSCPVSRECCLTDSPLISSTDDSPPNPLESSKVLLGKAVSLQDHDLGRVGPSGRGQSSFYFDLSGYLTASDTQMDFLSMIQRQEERVGRMLSLVCSTSPLLFS